MSGNISSKDQKKPRKRLLAKPRKQSDIVAIEAAKKTREGRPQRRSLTGQNMWHFMAWSFVLSQTLTGFEFLFGKAHARGIGEDSLSFGAGGDGSNLDLLNGNDLFSPAEEDYNSGPNSDLDGISDNQDNEDETLGDAPPEDSAQTDQYDNLDTASEPAGVGGGIVGSGTLFSSINPLPPLIVVDPLVDAGPPDLNFFDGFGTFADLLGLGEDPFGIANAVNTAAQGHVGLALGFAANPLTAFGVWQANGDIDADVTLSQNDGYNVEWAVQANGHMNDGIFQVQTASQSATGEMYQSTDVDAKEFGNTTVVVDGQDWDDTLWVTGDYYEFNTIIQVNILWDPDEINVTREGDETSIIPDNIHSGDNFQNNTALFIDVDIANYEDGGIDGDIIAPLVAPDSPDSPDGPELANTPDSPDGPDLAEPTHSPDSPHNADAGDDTDGADTVQADYTPDAPDISAASDLSDEEPLNAAVVDTTDVDTAEADADAEVGTEVVVEVADIEIITADDTVLAAQSTDGEPVDEETSGPPAVEQLIVGGTATYYSAVQVNSVVDADEILFDLADVVQGAGDFQGLGHFSDVQASGHTQSNDSILVESTPDYTPRISVRDYRDQFESSEITEFNGNFYEFNTIIQFNIVSDIQQFEWLSNGGADDPEAGDIASGGNFQFNHATLAHNDQHDNLFVGGQYTQYNLALQINSIEDNDFISQFSAVNYFGDGTNDAGNSDIENTADDGDSGDEGDSYSDFVLPTVFDDVLFRSPGADALI